jgi:uncharacterized protein
MSMLMTNCPTCGRTLDPTLGTVCPECIPETQQQERRALWGISTALVVWILSVGFLFLFQGIALVVYIAGKFAVTGQLPAKELTSPIALISLAATFLAHLATLAVCWRVVSSNGDRPFFGSLGWRWHTQFKAIHAIALAAVMLLLTVLLDRILPRGETDFEKMLQLGTAVRVSVALLAVFTAPLVEEVVYRGVIYSAIEWWRGRVAAVVLVSLLFGAVHVPQYLRSLSAIAAILALSIVLTLLRALTRQLLPCVATHLTFNLIQAVLLLAHQGNVPHATAPRTAASAVWHWIVLHNPPF